MASQCSLTTDTQCASIDGSVYEQRLNFHKCRANNINLTIVFIFWYLLNVHIYSLKLHLLFFHNVSVVYEAELYYLYILSQSSNFPHLPQFQTSFIHS